MQRRILAVAVLSALAIAGPVASSSAATKKKSSSKTAAAVVFGTVTSQGYPVVVELSKSAKKVVRAAIGLELQCGNPPNITLPDAFTNMTISKAGKFADSLPTTRVPADPSIGLPAVDVSASISGRFNKAKTSVKGKWTRKVVIYEPSDPTGVAIQDSCETTVNFTAKQ
jgi:hypothetical protein